MRKSLIISIVLICCIGLSLYSADDSKNLKKMPEILKQAKLEYPEIAKKKGIEAEVMVKAYVNKSGVVSEVIIEECTQSGMGFEAASEKAAYGMTFSPALDQKDNPVGCWVSYKVNFKLDCKKDK